jgi:nucleotide-binding universal stress UspA family protein
MYLMKKLAVVLDLNDLDDVVCDFVDRVARKAKFDSIDFIHVVKSLNLPDEIVDKYPSLITPLDESIKSAIQEKIAEYPSIAEHSNVNVHVIEGRKLQCITKFAHDNDIDLVVTDQGEQDEEHQVILPKLARNLTCDLAIVPPTVPEDINQVLVPVDFSVNSCMAIQFAQLLKSFDPNIRIHGLHVYRVPQGYRKSGKTFDEFAEVMLDNAKNELQRFYEENDIDGSDIEMNFVLKKGDSISTMINRFALSNKVDMILAGSRGTNTLSTFILGNIAEELITKDHYLPMVIVKNKSASMKLWEILMEL